MHNKRQIEGALEALDEELFLATLNGNESALSALQKQHRALMEAWQESAGL